ncbi:MAG: hypothetical protein EXS13_07945 [Planctomycetes bacterium]|nr:hypothetical protein [Planctomycetota bacterium]
MALKTWILGGAVVATLIATAIGTRSHWLPVLVRDPTNPRVSTIDRATLPDPASVDPALAALAPTARRDEAGGAAGDALNAEAAAAPLPPAGVVKVQVVDGERGVTLEDGVTIQFLSEQRFAKHEGGGAVEVPLTEGRWTACIHARGFEPYDLGAFVVVATTPVDLGMVALIRGNGVIEGEVIARHLGVDQPVRVALRGIGRARCAECLAPPETESKAGEPVHGCGDGDEPSWFTLSGTRRFRFQNLAQGTYWLRAIDPAQKIVEMRRVDIARGGYVWTALEVSAPTLARVELRHAHGALFHGDWEKFHAESPATIEFKIEREEKVVGQASCSPEADDVRASIGGALVPLPEAPPAAKGASEALLAGAQLQVSTDITSVFDVQLSFNFGGSDASSGLLVVGNWDGLLQSGGSGERLDRDRQEADSLEFVAGEPDLGAAELTLTKTRPDAFTLQPLPRSQLTVQVRCGGYESDRLPLDLRFGETLPLVVTMYPTEKRREELDWIALPEPESCTRCHEQRRDGNRSNFIRWVRSQNDVARQAQVIELNGDALNVGQ